MPMKVIKRDGRSEDVHMDKITARIRKLCDGLDSRYVDPVAIAMKVVQGIYDGVTTRELDQLAAETCAYSATYHPDWSTLAARIAVSDLHKMTDPSFSRNCQRLRDHKHPKTGVDAPLIAEDVNAIIQANAERLDKEIDYSRDFDFDYFGFKTLEKSYLLRINDQVAERPQHLFMRVSVGIHKLDIEGAVETYHLMSKRFFTHATPTLFNAGTPRPQLSSCFLLAMKDDSIDGIYETLKQCACISKYAGGIGLSIHNIRATKSYIRGTNGSSNGIVPMLRVYNDTARYVDQGGGKRKGSFAIYLEPWHADIHDFLELKKNHGKEEARARDLFYALWISDLFMQRVESHGEWTLFCPNEAPGLADCHGKEFEALYTRYEAEGRGRKTVKAQDLWKTIVTSQIETGTPYMLYKDACNSKSNQQNLGTIKSSNLCTEIIEYTSPDEVAVCNLASIAVPMFVRIGADGKRTYDYEGLVSIAKVATRNLNKVIDVNYYPIKEAEYSNMRHRPIGLGIQGLADCFAMMRYPFESEEAKQLNKTIFECIYYGAITASCELAAKHGPYETFPGSPASKGVLQFDMWGVEPSSELFDWKKVKEDVVKHGLRNSLLVAPMPTASTAQILGNNESFEPFTSNIYNRRVLAGEFPFVNRHLLRDLIERGLWNAETRMRILAAKGSIQGIDGIPDDLKALYRTVWEIKQKAMMDMAADRGAFICQSQSLNLFIAEPTVSKLSSAHFYAWKKGLKTGMYYLRTQPKADAIQFTVRLGEGEGVGGATPAGTIGFPSAALTASGGAGSGGGASGFAFPASGGASHMGGGGASGSASATDASPVKASASASSSDDELSIDGSPVKAATLSHATATATTTTATASSSSASSAAAAILSGGADTGGTGATGAPSTDGLSEAEKRKAAIRAALAAGSLEEDGDVCISCGS